MAEVIKIKVQDLLGVAELARLSLFERIRFVRGDILEMTQAEFARHVGVSLRQVKRWESSKAVAAQFPKAKAARQIALAAGGRYPAELFMAAPVFEETAAREILRKLDLIMAHLGIEE